MTKYEQTLKIIEERRKFYKNLWVNTENKERKQRWYEAYLAIELLQDEIIERVSIQAQ